MNLSSFLRRSRLVLVIAVGVIFEVSAGSREAAAELVTSRHAESHLANHGLGSLWPSEELMNCDSMLCPWIGRFFSASAPRAAANLLPPEPTETDSASRSDAPGATAEFTHPDRDEPTLYGPPLPPGFASNIAAAAEVADTSADGADAPSEDAAYDEKYDEPYDEDYYYDAESAPYDDRWYANEPNGPPAAPALPDAEHSEATATETPGELPPAGFEHSQYAWPHAFDSIDARPTVPGAPADDPESEASSELPRRDPSGIVPPMELENFAPRAASSGPDPADVSDNASGESVRSDDAQNDDATEAPSAAAASLPKPTQVAVRFAARLFSGLGRASLALSRELDRMADRRPPVAAALR